MKSSDAVATEWINLRKAKWLGGGVALLSLGLLFGRWSSPAVPATPSADPGQDGGNKKSAVWTCSMHPQIRRSNPGQCPLCGMDLIPVSEGGSDAGVRELTLSLGAATLAEIETEPVRRREVEREVRMVGKVDYDETRLNYITAWVPGRLDRLFVDYTGTLVRKDDHLLEVYSPPLLSAQEELLQALQARESLREGGSHLLREMADQTVKSAREKLRLWGLGQDQIAEIERTNRTSDHVTIRAPIGGIVVHKNKNTGDYVKTGERVYTIADLTQVWIKLDAYESDLPWVRYGQTVTFETESYPGVPFEGRVVFVDPVLAAKTRTVKVRLNVDNREGRLKPGMFVRAVLHSPLQAEGQTLDPSLAGKWICPMHWDVIKDGQANCDQCGMPLVRAETLHRSGDPSAKLPLVVPASAVLWTGVRSLVYIREPGELPVFRGQEIVLGPRAGKFYVVREGLAEGQLVVTQGAFKIDSALQIQARPSMMLPPEGQGEQPRHEATAAFMEALDPVFEGYLAVQAALANDDVEAARTAAQALSSTVRGVDMQLVTGPGHVAWMRLAKRLRDGADAGAAGTTIEEARASFVELSGAILDLERQFGHAQGVLREGFCPMARDNKGASWLQRAEEIQNPFFGASMLSCGEVRATFSGRNDAPRHEHGNDEGSDDPGGHPPMEPGQRGGRRESPPMEQGEPLPTTSPTRPPDLLPAEEEPAPGAQQRERFLGGVDRLLAAYFALQRDLAEDKPSGKKHALEMGRALQVVEPTSLTADDRADWRDVRLPAIQIQLERLAEALDLEAQRQVFEALSTVLAGVVSRYGHMPERSVRRFHCPMAFGNRGADWLQEGERTLNPYFGSRMLRCGRQVEVLPAEVRPLNEARIWTCSMHPQVRLSAPGKCPICGMDLMPFDDAGEEGAR